ncbi:hypothetical protein [Prosthecobacter vanneervenii]|uniref:Uncharacterized protein n=1 Tax=Prosthecobacter vanneervenii TaxID=48466 RepID=A0A7W7YG66_9BACT|nr:hypothetical protein [Prosthecobacter vanneervenii]MBB5035563.1 hypothetical protein [Prosthecobacter vanneervenii]
MKTHALILIIAAVAAAMGLGACTNAEVVKINTPAVRAQILGDAEKDLIAGGGALLLSGGNSGAAVAAVTAQELKNLPELQSAIQTAQASAADTASAQGPVTAVTP